MGVTPERLHEIRYLLQSWLDRETASLIEIQYLLGKLNFIAACVRPGRIFIVRMLQLLEVLNKKLILINKSVFHNICKKMFYGGINSYHYITVFHSCFMKNGQSQIGFAVEMLAFFLVVVFVQENIIILLIALFAGLFCGSY